MDIDYENKIIYLENAANWIYKLFTDQGEDRYCLLNLIDNHVIGFETASPIHAGDFIIKDLTERP